MTATAGPAGVLAYLAALVGSAPAGQLLELRHRRPGGGMGQRFFDVSRPDAAAAAIAVLSRTNDVYVGVAPRTRRAGTRSALAAGWTLWVDCDDAAAAEALERFELSPAITVRSSARGVHAYWPLTKPLGPDELEQANRRFAVALGACQSAVTGPAAILRPPSTLNFKYDPPAPVVLERFTGERFEASELLAILPALPPRRRPAPASPTVTGGDPLRAIDPAVYVRALTGREPGRNRKVACPLHHPDQTPSLHVYETPEDGWYCFGACRRGGDVYDFGGALLGLSTKGPGFLELRRRLYELLLPGREPPEPTRRRRRRRRDRVRAEA